MVRIYAVCQLLGHLHDAQNTLFWNFDDFVGELGRRKSLRQFGIASARCRSFAATRILAMRPKNPSGPSMERRISTQLNWIANLELKLHSQFETSFIEWKEFSNVEFCEDRDQRNTVNQQNRK